MWIKNALSSKASLSLSHSVDIKDMRSACNVVIGARRYWVRHLEELKTTLCTQGSLGQFEGVLGESSGGLWSAKCRFPLPASFEVDSYPPVGNTRRYTAHCWTENTSSSWIPHFRLGNGPWLQKPFAPLTRRLFVPLWLAFWCDVPGTSKQI